MFKRKTSILAVVLVAASLVFGGACGWLLARIFRGPADYLPGESGMTQQPSKQERFQDVVTSISPAPGSEARLLTGNILEVRFTFSRPMQPKASVSTGSAETYYDEKTQSYVVRLDVGAVDKAKEFSFTVTFLDLAGNAIQIPWRGTVLPGDAIVAEIPGDKSGSASDQKPENVPKTSLPEWGTMPLKVISIRPEPGSKVVLSPEGTFDVTVEFNQRMPIHVSSGLGGSQIKGDIRDTNNEILGSTITWHCASYPGKEFWLMVSLRDKDGKELQHWWPNYVMTKPVVNVNPPLAYFLHLSAWRRLISEAKEDDIARLALYATRTIAVKHPEIYLTADRLFYETAKTTKGLRELYEYNPPTWTYRPEELQREESRFDGLLARVGTSGTPLDLSTLDLSAYHVVTRGELYPLGVPSYFLLDQRVGALPVVLKRDNGKVTSLEMAFLRYFVTGPSDKNYIVLSEDETAYLWLSGTGLLDSDGKRTEAVSARPILIFNERYVWFPITGRDDTSKDHVLAELVRELSGQISSTTSGTEDSPSPLPAGVSSEEKDLLAEIAPLSALSEKDLPYAVWAASKARYRSAHFSPYREALKAIPYFPTNLGALESLEWQKFHIIGHTFQIHSNRVSPLTASIAAQEFSDPLDPSLTLRVAGRCL